MPAFAVNANIRVVKQAGIKPAAKRMVQHIFISRLFSKRLIEIQTFRLN